MSWRARLPRYLMGTASMLVCAAVFAETADEFAAAARAAARIDQNRQAAELFEQALAMAPERRREWLREYADQLTYSSRAARAVPLYREYLAATNDDEGRRHAQKGLALALSWADRNDAARVAYEALLAEHPGDVEAQRNLGRVISWSGRQREAQAYLRDFLARHPDDREARVLLAQAQWWLGRPDAARATLADPALAAARRDDALRLTGAIERTARQTTRLDVQRSSQSDDLDITTTTLDHQWMSGSGLTMLAPRLQYFRYDPRGSGPGVTIERPGARARHRLGDDFEVNAEAAIERIQPQGLPDYSRFTYNSWATWWPGDRLRLDVAANRSTFDNVRSLQRRIVAHGEGASVDWLPSESQRLTGRLSRAAYSDGNRRDFGQVEAEVRLKNAQPLIWAGMRFTHFDFAQQLDNGYFNPRTYNAYLLTLRMEGLPRDETRFSWRVQLAGGKEYARPDGDKPVYEASAGAAWRVTAETTIEARLQRFSSRTASASGFARTTAAITLVHGWKGL